MSALELQDGHIAQLQSFLAAVDQLPLPLDAEVEAAQDYAESLLEELTAPVRVAVAGGRRTGKSSLVNLLAGVDIVPSGPDSHLLPPVILRYAKQERTLAGWWDRPEQVIDGLDVTGALSESPDVISFEIDCEALTDLWLIDVSGVDHPSRGKEARFALSRLADVLLWCSDATTADVKSEAANWQLLPPHLRKHSVLVLSHVDQAGDAQLARVQDIASGAAQTSFRHVAPVSIREAWGALVAGDEAADQTWQDSGAAALIETLMSVVDAYQSDRLQRVRRAMQRFVTPVMDRLTPAQGGGQTAPADAPAATVPEPPIVAPPAVAEEGPDPMEALLAQWSDRLCAYREQFAEAMEAADPAAIEEAHVLVNGFLEEIANPGVLPAEAGWLIEEFERADDLLILLQFEEPELVLSDAMQVLWQLSDSLSWAGRAAA